MSRLKKIAGGNDPFVSNKVEQMVKLPNENPNEDKSEYILLAKELIAALPLSPSNSVTYLLADAIENGELNVQSNATDSATLIAVKEFLKAKGIVVNAKKKRLAGPNNLYTDKYTDNAYTNNYLDMHKDVNKQNSQSIVPSEKEKFISDSYSLAKDLVYGLPIVPRYDLMSQIAQDIERGDFDDISSQADARSHWDSWLARAKQILRARNIIIS
ncbi:hypothetical protein D3C87_76300 [compost metagenome]